MRIRTLVLLFIAALITGLVVKFPIGLLVKDQRWGPVSLTGVTGTVWSGQVRSIRINSEEISQVSWRVNPLYLLLGQLSAYIEFDFLEHTGDAQVSLSIARTLKVQAFEFIFPADVLAQKFAGGFVGFEGDLNMQIDRLTYRLGTPFIDGLDMTAQWYDAGVSYPVSVSLGNVLLNTDQERGEDTFAFKIANQDGEIDLDGDVKLTAARTYDVRLKLTPNEKTSQVFKDSVSNFLKQQADGSYLFVFNDRL